jgi:hypothetical protein
MRIADKIRINVSNCGHVNCSVCEGNREEGITGGG